MSSGIYCKPKNSNEVYNSILIDEYNKCVFGLPKVEPKDHPLVADMMKASAGSSQEEERWEVGMNCRARFSQDGEYYEAVIEKILDDEYAVVRFLGYENKEAVKIDSLRPSGGEEFIYEQLELVELDAKNNEDDEDDECQEIEWKPGMPCRALYAGNDVIYEGTIQEVSSQRRKAVVIMAGYGIPYESNFSDIYESIPDLRVKQLQSALKNSISKKPATEGSTKMSNDIRVDAPGVRLADDGVTMFQKPQPTPGIQIPIPPVPEPTFPQGVKPQAELNFSNPSVNSSCIFSQYQGMMQPQNESDALACLVSSNYLSGYYAGFYDCLKKFQGQRNA